MSSEINDLGLSQQPRVRRNSSRTNLRVLSLVVGGTCIGITLGIRYRANIYEIGRDLIVKIPIKESLKIAIAETAKAIMLDSVEAVKHKAAHSIGRFLYQIGRTIRPVIRGPVRNMERKFYKLFGVRYDQADYTDDEDGGIGRATDRKAISTTETLRYYAQRTELENEVLAGLSNCQASSVLLLGPPGSGKSSLIAGVAKRLKEKKDIHPQLKNMGIVEVKMGEFLKGGKDRFMDKVLVFLKQFEGSKEDKIIYIDEFWAIKGQDQLSQFFREELKSLLAKNNHLRLLCCTTLDGYENVDKAFERRFTVVNVFEPSDVVLREMLYSHLEVLEKHHKCMYPDSIIEDVIELTKDIPNSYHPAKAISVLDAVGSWAWVGFNQNSGNGSSCPIITRGDVEKVVRQKKEAMAATKVFLESL